MHEDRKKAQSTSRAHHNLEPLMEKTRTADTQEYLHKQFAYMTGDLPRPAPCYVRKDVAYLTKNARGYAVVAQCANRKKKVGEKPTRLQGASCARVTTECKKSPTSPFMCLSCLNKTQKS